MKHKNQVFIIVALILFACQSKQRINQPIQDSVTEKQVKYSDNPGICQDTCFGSFKEFGEKRIGKTLNIYISGYKVELSKDCCQFTFGEIVHNIVPNDSMIEVVKVHLIDTVSFIIPNDSSLYGDKSVLRKVMCLCTIDTKTWQMKFNVDPYDFGIYMKPENWNF